MTPGSFWVHGQSIVTYVSRGPADSAQKSPSSTPGSWPVSALQIKGADTFDR